ncbi:MAG: cytochrome c [Nitrospirota bacterium]
MSITLRKRTTVFSLLTGAGLACLIAGGVGATPKQVVQQGFAWKDGAEVYAKVCAFCHETAVGPVILGRGHHPLYISLMVRNGNRAMPAFRATEIDDKSLQKLAEFVSKSQPDQ